MDVRLCNRKCRKRNFRIVIGNVCKIKLKILFYEFYDALRLKTYKLLVKSVAILLKLFNGFIKYHYMDFFSSNEILILNEKVKQFIQSSVHCFLHILTTFLTICGYHANRNVRLLK